MLTINRILKTNGVTGEWSDEFGQVMETPTIAIGMRCRFRLALYTDRIDGDGKLIPIPYDDLRTVSYYIALDSDHLQETTPKLCNTTGCTLECDADTGGAVFVCDIPNTAVPDLLQCIASEKTISLETEIAGMESADGVASFLIQTTIDVRNRVWLPGSGTLPGEVVNDPEYWPGTQIEAYLSQTPELQFSADGANWHDELTSASDVWWRWRFGKNGAWTKAYLLPRGASISNYLYVAYASDAAGTGFSLTPSDALLYRAEVVSETEIENPTAADFAGKWVRFVGEQGNQGKPGAVFIPSVSSEGILSWTNDGNLENPSSVSVKGPAGADVNPKGVWSATTTYSKNDLVRSGTATWISKVDNNTGNVVPTLPAQENDYWYLNLIDGATFTPAVSADGVLSWSNNGDLANPDSVNIKGSDGKTGATGTTFTPAVSADGILSWSNNGDLANPDSVNIKGSDGDIGPQGAAAISFAVLTAITDETTYTGTAQLVNADGTAGETVDIVYDFDAPTETTEE